MKICKRILPLLLVLLMLPALLILCDGIVCRTTRGMKPEKKKETV